MKLFSKNSIAVVLGTTIFSLAFVLTAPMTAMAATTPSLGTASTYGVLTGTFNYNGGLTTITGVGGTDVLGITAAFPGGGASLSVTGVTETASAAYTQAGLDQGTLLTALNVQACGDGAGVPGFTFAPGVINLATDTTHGTIGVYTPGVYCSTGAMNVGTAGITLTGSGTYIFRSTSSFDTATGSIVSLAGGASACNVFWTPAAATTLAHNTTFVGTVVDNAGITVGSTVSWLGRALAYAAALGTVTLDTDTITVPSSCVVTPGPSGSSGGGRPSSPAPSLLHVIKLVVSASGTIVAPSNFSLHVKNDVGMDVAGSPAPGATAPGILYSMNPGTYTVSEDANAAYTQSFTGDCNAAGVVTVSSGVSKICTVVNTDIPLVSAAHIIPLIGLLKVPTPLALPNGAGQVTYNYTVWNVGGLQALANVTLVDDKCSMITLVSGDTNQNGKLEPSEQWKYRCVMTLGSTTTNTAVATGYSDDAYHQAAIATAIATVVVGAPIVPPIINIVKVPSRLTPFPFGGGSVFYTYTVTNPGIVPLQDVTVTDDKCSAVGGPFGDVNHNNMLDSNESWIFGCTMNVAVSTRNIATARGTANGILALGYAFATVVVSAPGLPNTGFAPASGIPWNIVIPGAALAALMLFLVLKRKHA